MFDEGSLVRASKTRGTIGDSGMRPWASQEMPGSCHIDGSGAEKWVICGIASGACSAGRDSIFSPLCSWQGSLPPASNLPPHVCGPGHEGGSC